LGAVLVLLILIVAFMDWNALRAPIARMAGAKLHRTVQLDGPLEVHLFSLTPSISIADLKVGNPEWERERQMLDVARITASIELLPLLVGHRIVRQIEVDRPRIYLHQDASKRANWQFQPAGAQPQPQQPSKPPELPVIKRLIVKEGDLEIRDEVRKLTFKGTLNAHEESQQREARAFALQGQGILNGKKFDLNVAGDPLINAEPDRPYTFDAAVKAADIRVSVQGRIPRPFDMSRVQADIVASGQDFADIYYLTGLALPNTPPYKVSTSVERDDNRITLRHFSGLVGKSKIQGDGAIDLSSGRPTVTANISSPLLRLRDFVASFGVSPESESSKTPDKGTLAGKQKPATVSESPFLLPDSVLQLERVRGMDAAVRFRADKIESGKVPLTGVALDIKLDHGILDIAPFAIAFPQGEFSGDARIDARKDVPLVNVDAKLRNVHLEKLLQTREDSQPAIEGLLVGRVRLHGAGASVHEVASNADGTITAVIPHGEIRAAFAELTGINIAEGVGLLIAKRDQQAEVRCGVADFQAERGVLQSRAVIFDTSNVLVTGGGHINLATEALDLSVQGHPKKVRLVRLRSPIKLQGHLKQPKIGLDAGKTVAQTGIAAALGALVTPLAAIVAFVDPGLAEDANCAALLAEAKQKGVPGQLTPTPDH